MPDSHPTEQLIEALIFASEQSLELFDLKQVLRESTGEELNNDELENMLDNIRKRYERPESVLELVFLNNGYQFLTKKEYHPLIRQLQAQHSTKRLSQAALETLSIVAYRQPVTKLDIEQIRGVSSDYSLQKLLEKGLIQISGKSERVGRPLLYSTSDIFMDYFGLKNASELPQIKDLMREENNIGGEERE